MKKILFAIILLSSSLSNHAQMVIKRERVQKQQPTVIYRETPNSHLSFNGVDINGTINSFLDKLKSKGYKKQLKLVEEGDAVISYASGPYAGIEGWNISFWHDEEHNDSISAVSMFVDNFATGMTLMNRYETVKQYIKSNYYITEETLYETESSITGDNEALYKIGNKGTITVKYGNDEGNLFLHLLFKDNINEKLFETPVTTKKYELSGLSNIYSRCLIESSDYEIRFAAETNNGSYSFLARGKDARLLQNALSGKSNKVEQFYLLNNYILSGINRSKNTACVPVLETQAERIANDYIAAVEKARRLPSRSNMTGNILIEALRQMIYTPKEREILDQVISPDMQRQLLRGTLMMMGSSTSHTDYEKYINPYVHD